MSKTLKLAILLLTVALSIMAAAVVAVNAQSATGQGLSIVDEGVWSGG